MANSAPFETYIVFSVDSFQCMTSTGFLVELVVKYIFLSRPRLQTGAKLGQSRDDWNSRIGIAPRDCACVCTSLVHRDIFRRMSPNNSDWSKRADGGGKFFHFWLPHENSSGGEPSQQIHEAKGPQAAG